MESGTELDTDCYRNCNPRILHRLPISTVHHKPGKVVFQYCWRADSCKHQTRTTRGGDAAIPWTGGFSFLSPLLSLMLIVQKTGAMLGRRLMPRDSFLKSLWSVLKYEHLGIFKMYRTFNHKQIGLQGNEWITYRQ